MFSLIVPHIQLLLKNHFPSGTVFDFYKSIFVIIKQIEPMLQMVKGYFGLYFIDNYKNVACTSFPKNQMVNRGSFYFLTYKKDFLIFSVHVTL